MIVSYSRRFIFVHVHKTAGEAVTQALAPHLGRGDLVLGATTRGNLAEVLFPRKENIAKHSAAGDIKRWVGDEIWSDYFKFSVVRHPIERTISLYRYLKRVECQRQRLTLKNARYALPRFWRTDPRRWPGMRALTETATFSEFIRHPSFMQAPAARTQVGCLCDANERLLVDLVCHFETIERDFKEVAGRIGIESVRLKRVNVSGGGEKAVVLTPEDRDYLADWFAADFRAFNYER